MDESFTAFELIGITMSVLLASILFCILSYALNLMWCLLLPCRGIGYCCRQMQYDDDDHQTCCCLGGNIIV